MAACIASGQLQQRDMVIKGACSLCTGYQGMHSVSVRGTSCGVLTEGGAVFCTCNRELMSHDCAQQMRVHWRFGILQDGRGVVHTSVASVVVGCTIGRARDEHLGLSFSTYRV